MVRNRKKVVVLSTGTEEQLLVERSFLSYLGSQVSE